MKDRRSSTGDRFAVVFPFSIGCMSQSSVAVADPNEKKQTQSDPSPSSATSTTQSVVLDQEGGGGEETTKQAEKGIVTAGVQRLVKRIKSLSQMFAVYDDGEEEEEEEMVIGYPTDVQHVGHIGWDGHGGLNKVGAAAAMGMVNAFSQLPSSLSLSRRLEVAMDQAAHA